MINPPAVEIPVDPKFSPAAELAVCLQEWNMVLCLAASSAPWVLTETAESGLQLRSKDQGSIRVDFLSPTLSYRRKFGGGRRQALARAVGVKGSPAPFVLDATAGLGRDAFILASLGCRVHMVERSPLLAILLWDGLRRAEQDAQIGDWVKAGLSLHYGDSRQCLSTLTEPPDVVYLDPMFPEKKKTALVKKEMQILQTLLGEVTDTGELLSVARTMAKTRVVVKRPLHAEPLAGLKPDSVIKSKKSRFDIYLTGSA